MGFREILSYDFRVADADTIRMGISRESGEAPRTWGTSWPGGGRLEQGSLAIPRNVSLSRIDEHQSCEEVPTLWLGTPRKTIRGWTGQPEGADMYAENSSLRSQGNMAT